MNVNQKSYTHKHDTTQHAPNYAGQITPRDIQSKKEVDRLYTQQTDTERRETVVVLSVQQ